MAPITTIVKYLDTLLESASFDDASANGLQVESSCSEVSRIAVAVDAGLSVIEQAVEQGAQMLIVHHGLFWGDVKSLCGALARKVELLMRSECSLYASHLPLDAHYEVGNGTQLARCLNLSNIKPFCEYRGKLIGAKGEFERSTSIEEVLKQCAQIPHATPPKILRFGKKEIKSVGVVTGSGAFALRPCADEGLDLLVSGEPKHEAYHLAKELGINAIFAGHYATETFGVLALGRTLKKRVW